MVNSGFATCMEDGTVNVPDEQKKRILNLGESALLMDGSTQKKGSCPSVTLYDRSLPAHGFIASKTSQSTTLITGSTAAGEALPPHFQFSTTAKSEEHAHICLESVKFMKNVIGQFRHDVVKSFTCTIGLNEKGEMDKENFMKYIFINIIPLYSYAKDVPGKRVCIKLDSRLGQINAELMVWLRVQGFYVFPGVPNTTAVTQETDKKCGAFKNKF